MTRAKADLRARMLAMRRALDPGLRVLLSRRIEARLLELEPYQSASVVHLYIGALGGEVETREIALAALREGKRLACPRVDRSATRLEHYEIGSLADLVESPRGLWEPDPVRTRKIALKTIDLVLVPGIAFDRLGHRIGFGAGYYDRFLAEVEAPKIGLAYSLQVSEWVPSSSRDIPVDWVVTEAETIPCRANRQAAEGEARASEARR